MTASCALALFSGVAAAAEPAFGPPSTIRGIWVDAFGAGFRTPKETDQLIQDAKALGVNAIFAQIGRRADCYCSIPEVPRTEDRFVAANFDPLGYLIRQAHAEGIQVHAWMTSTGIHASGLGTPKNSRHVFNAHGEDQYGVDNWLSYRYDGVPEVDGEYFLDPGNPQAADYIAQMYVGVVRAYDVDGVMLDRIRYPDTTLQNGYSAWGYNAYSLERYRRETGTSGIPKPSDARWSDWRRQQIDQLVRKIYLEVKAVKPQVWVSAATITYGAAPQTPKDFANSRAYREVLQNWPSWLENRYLDLAVMMNYRTQSVRAQDYHNWNSFGQFYSGRVLSGSAMYFNPLADTKAQIADAESMLGGWVGYAYRNPSTAVAEGRQKQATAWANLVTMVGRPVEPWNWTLPPLTALKGRLRGDVLGLGGKTVELWRNGLLFGSTLTDGSGYYAFTQLPAGKFEVRVAGYQSAVVAVRLDAINQAPEIWSTLAKTR